MMRDPSGERWSIAQGLIWLTTCAIYLASARRTLLDVPQSVHQFLVLFGLTFFTGTCWFGMTWVAWRLLAQRRAEIEPGLWLLCVMGMVQMVNWALAELPATRQPFGLGVEMAATCLATLAPTFQRRLEPRWAAYYLMLASLQVARLGSVVGRAFFTHWSPTGLVHGLSFAQAIGMLGLLGLGVCVAADARARSQRSLLHWIGVTLGASWFLWHAWPVG